MSTVTVNGNTYSSAGEAANDMRSGGHRTHLLPMLADAVVDLAAKVSAAQLAETNAELAETNAETAEVNAELAETNAETAASNAAASESAAAISAAEAAASAASLHGTSTSSLLIATGSKSFTTQAAESYTAGAWVTATSAGNLANWMYGQITSYSGTTLVVDVQVIGGSGTYADWNLSIAAARGATGATGPAGNGITPQTVGWTGTGGTTPKTLTVDADLTTSNFQTTSSPEFAALNIGHATDTTLTRVSAGVVAVEGNTLGFLNIPQNSQSAAYELVLADSGKHIYHPPADTTARTWTIPANASVAFPIGTAIVFDNDYLAGVLTIAITSDTMVLVGTVGSTGSRTLASGGQATAVKVTSTRWRITGVGLT